jgi:XTP/dITP diphosphohydrolase
VTPPRLLLATRNAHKVTEVRRILLEAGVDLDLLSLREVPPYDETPETGATFAENALAKAREAVHHTGLAAIADDSGLTVEALHGMPGVLSARWAGPQRDDRANLQLVLAQLTEVPDERRGAAFVCAAALVLPDGSEQVVEGRVAGRLLHEPRGENGFGYDPLFVPDGADRTTAEMTPAEKDALSHRGQAFRELVSHIAEKLL